MKYTIEVYDGQQWTATAAQADSRPDARAQVEQLIKETGKRHRLICGGIVGYQPPTEWFCKTA